MRSFVKFFDHLFLIRETDLLSFSKFCYFVLFGYGVLRLQMYS